MKTEKFRAAFAIIACLAAGSSSALLHAEPVSNSVRLRQGWSKGESEWFHYTTQGSHFMPYAFFIALEQAGNRKPLNSPEFMEKFRCIPQAPTPVNPDGLPIGFVADPGSSVQPGLLRDNRSLGFTCAACHTSQLTYQGTSMLIDGGPTMADMDALIVAIKDAVVTTVSSSEKFERFADKVLGTDSSRSKRELLRKELNKTSKAQRAYINMNYTSVRYGYARLDAFGRIFNNALLAVGSDSRVKPDAPVSYPFLWDTVKSDCVQWTGNAKNGVLGSLGRNVGEVVGVFAAIDTGGGDRVPAGYGSSVNFKNLRRLESALHGLKSPHWPENILPKIDQAKAREGAKLFKTHCASCHTKINWWSFLPFVKSFKSHLTPLNGPGGVATDRTSAALIRDSRGKSGVLRGERKLFSLKQTYDREEPVNVMVEDTVVRVLIGGLEGKRTAFNSINRALMQGNDIDTPTDDVAQKDDLSLLMPTAATEATAEQQGSTLSKTPLVYRARPLDGIWATGPFLHNGSVPTLFDLLRPENERPDSFHVGSREFDPVKVGPVTTEGEGTSHFNTKLKGNSNKGHDYGTSSMTDEQRWQLVEYMKTL